VGDGRRLRGRPFRGGAPFCGGYTQFGLAQCLSVPPVESEVADADEGQPLVDLTAKDLAEMAASDRRPGRGAVGLPGERRQTAASKCYSRSKSRTVRPSCTNAIRDVIGWNQV